MSKYFILSQEEDHIRVYEDFYGGTYDIMLNPLGDFDYAIRWMDRIGINPIRYTSINEIPHIHQSLVEDVILRRKRRKYRALNERA
jgi:hypothetical protein